MNVLLQKCENKTHYKLEINRCNGKSFCKLQVTATVETVLLYTFKTFAEKQSYLFTFITYNFHINVYLMYLAYL